MSRQSWTTDEDAYALAAAGQSHSNGEIATRLGRSEQAVTTRLQKLGFSRAHQWSPIEDTYLINHFEQLPLAELAKGYGCESREVTKRYAALTQRDLIPNVCANPMCRAVFYALATAPDMRCCSPICMAHLWKIRGPEFEELAELYESGRDLDWISDWFGVSKGYIANEFRAHKMQTVERLPDWYVLPVENGEDRLENLFGKYQRAKQDRSPFKGGLRPDLAIVVRSAWEANVARWLSSRNIKWEYEPRRFTFPVARGARSYLPDFWLPEDGLWIEVKGYLKSTDVTRLKRFKKYFPDEFVKLRGLPKNENSEAARGFEELDVPIYAYYDEISHDKATIEAWE